MIYLLISGPSFLLHHHNNKIVSYEKANPCEKAIYYENKDGKCTHQKHISKAYEKCWFCETHTISPYISQKNCWAFSIGKEFIAHQTFHTEKKTTDNYFFSSDRAPPSSHF